MEVLEKIYLTDQQIEQIEAGISVAIPASEDEFLEFAFETPYRVEFLEDKIIIMGLARFLHELMVGYFISLFTIYYKTKEGYYVAGSNVGINMRGTKKYLNPDAVILKGLPIFKGKSESIVTNPYLVVEVFSPATKIYDLEIKLNLYLKIESLQFLVFADINEKVVMVYQRTNDGKSWIYTHYDSPEETVNIDECKVVLHEIFDSLPKL
jgi:Uma2 family endonuclease